MTKTAQILDPNAEQERQRQLLEALVVRNRELEQLEARLGRFNIFTALGIARQELKHSNFLAYILSPRQSHRLGVAFLKRFLESALAGNPGFGPLEVSLWRADGAVVLREWQNIDITIRDDQNKIGVIIENKIDAEEGPNQLQTYFEVAESEFFGWRVIAIYLTPEKDRPSDDRYIPMSYSQVYDAVERVISSTPNANEGVRLGLTQYAEMLRRYVVAESEISGLCRQIYEQHREALDLIIQHIPDQRDLVRQLAEALIRNCADMELDASTKSVVRFWVKSVDAPSLRQSSWTDSKRILLFEFDLYVNELWLRLYIGPGPKELRQKLYDMAKGKKPLKPSEKLGEQWNTIFSRKLLNSESYQKPKEQLEVELKEKWEHFRQHDLPQIISIIKTETWIFEEPEGVSKAATKNE
jgi:hypothetical protein